VFAVRQEKMHGKVCVCRAPMQKRTANIFLAVRIFSPCVFEKTHGKAPLCRAPEKYARQTFRRTANMEFPVVVEVSHQYVSRGIILFLQVRLYFFKTHLINMRIVVIRR
jgi:hypothetical protein